MKPSENSDFGALSQPIDPTDRPAGGVAKPFTGTKTWGAGMMMILVVLLVY